MDNKPSKRELVEMWLHDICTSCESLATAEDDYHPGEYDADIEEMLKSADGLVSLVEYEPGSDDWENFEPEGYLWSTPTDAQVEKLYPLALQWHTELESDNG
jgi:hypothetical protein